MLSSNMIIMMTPSLICMSINELRDIFALFEYCITEPTDSQAAYIATVATSQLLYTSSRNPDNSKLVA